jgi:hypothetical protein
VERSRARARQKFLSPPTPPTPPPPRHLMKFNCTHIVGWLGVSRGEISEINYENIYINCSFAAVEPRLEEGVRWPRLSRVCGRRQRANRAACCLISLLKRATMINFAEARKSERFLVVALTTLFRPECRVASLRSLKSRNRLQINRNRR